MSNQENIDKLFQDNLTNLEHQPRPEVWEGIKGKLQKKKKTRVLFWWMYSGAAVLLITLTLITLETSEDSNEPLKVEPKVTTSPLDGIKREPVLKEKLKDSLVKKQEKKGRIASQKKKELLLEEEIINSNSIHRKEKVSAFNLSFSSIQSIDYNFVLDIHPIQKSEEPTLKNIMNVVQNKDNIKDKKIRRWAVQSSFGYANTSSNNTTSDVLQVSTTNNTEIRGENSFSFGIKASYQINESWSVQSGIHSQRLGYFIDNVSVLSGINSAGFINVNSALGSPLLITNSSFVSAFLPFNPNANEIIGDAVLQQSYSYIEIPLEVKYRLTNESKFSIGLVSGFSTLFLNKNEVNVKNDQLSLFVGKSNDLNTLNFSGNVGFDFDYSISKKWIFNFNPMLKIHLNTFSNNSNGFKPYFLGVSSGVKYSF